MTYSQLIREFEQSSKDARRFAGETGGRLFLTRPAPGRWSPAECFDHLVHFNRGYHAEMSTAQERISPLPEQAEDSFRPRLVARWVIRFFEPPYRMKVKTLRPFYPGENAEMDPDGVMERYLETHGRFRGLLEEAASRRLDLEEVRVSHPIFGWLKMSLADCYGIILAHQRRHLWQAEQVVEALREGGEFPEKGRNSQTDNPV